MSMIRLIYSSRAATAFDERELWTLLSVSQENNVRDGLTGKLVHLYLESDPDQAWFLQVLEGESSKVDVAMARIKADELHHEIQILSRATVVRRIFPAWSMRLSVVSGYSAQIIEDTSGLEDAVRNLRTAESLLYGISNDARLDE